MMFNAFGYFKTGRRTTKKAWTVKERTTEAQLRNNMYESMATTRMVIVVSQKIPSSGQTSMSERELLMRCTT
jgi:hypothetical protein